MTDKQVSFARPASAQEWLRALAANPEKAMRAQLGLGGFPLDTVVKVNDQVVSTSSPWVESLRPTN